jgi:hypothetical protein
VIGYRCPDHGRITVRQVALRRAPNETAPMAVCAVTIRRPGRQTAAIEACGLPLEILDDAPDTLPTL